MAICAICFGWPILNSLQYVLQTDAQTMTQAQDAAAFSDASFIGLIVMELITAGVALLVLHHRKFAVERLYPAPTVRGFAIAILLYLGAAYASQFVLTIFHSGSADEPVQRSLAAAVVSPPVLAAVGVVNGMYEEVFLLGYLQRGLRDYGASLALGLPLLIRALYHLYQGPSGVVSVLIFGLVLAIFYRRTESLFPVVFAHVLADILPFVSR